MDGRARVTINISAFERPIEEDVDTVEVFFSGAQADWRFVIPIRHHNHLLRRKIFVGRPFGGIRLPVGERIEQAIHVLGADWRQRLVADDADEETHGVGDGLKAAFRRRVTAQRRASRCWAMTWRKANEEVFRYEEGESPSLGFECEHQSQRLVSATHPLHP